MENKIRITSHEKSLREMENLIQRGMTVTKAEQKIGMYAGWCRKHYPETFYFLKNVAEKKRTVKRMKIHANIVEKWIEYGYCSAERLSKKIKVHPHVISEALNRYFDKEKGAGRYIMSKI